MVTFTNTERQLSDRDIDVIELMVGLKFPDQYRKHLLMHNGGQCKPNVFTFVEKGKFSDSQVDRFLAIYDGEYDNLKDDIEIFKLDEKRMPSHMVPIAHDPGGNLICISCGSSDFGAVYFWDHENEVDYSVADDRDYSNLYKIADNLTEFFDGLTVFEG